MGYGVRMALVRTADGRVHGYSDAGNPHWKHQAQAAGFDIEAIERVYADFVAWRREQRREALRARIRALQAQDPLPLP